MAKKTPTNPKASKAKGASIDATKPEDDTLGPDDADDNASQETGSDPSENIFGEDGVSAGDTPKVAEDAPAEDTTVEDAEADEDTSAPEEAPDATEPDSTEVTEPETEPELEPEPEPDPAPTAPAPRHNDPVVQRKGGFVPMALGGVVAAGLGFGASHFGLITGQNDQVGGLETRVEQSLAQQAEQVAGLSAALEDMSENADLPALQSAQEDLLTSLGALSDRLTGVEDQITGVQAQLSELEKRPITEGASDAAVAAYERELKALQDAMAAQRAEVEDMAANTEASAQATIRRAALTRIQTALDAGTGFAPALADLEGAGVAVPEALSALAQTGAPSLSDLQAGFPQAARKALAAARQANQSEGETGGFSAFLKAQLGARSLEPQEGSSPDAVLSRAEAATREGRLADALAEIDALPEAGQSALSDWAAAARQRLGAVSAAEALGSELN